MSSTTDLERAHEVNAEITKAIWSRDTNGDDLATDVAARVIAAALARAREEGAREAQAENARYREALEKIAHDHEAHARLILCYDTPEERQAASLAVGWAQDRAKLALAVERVAS
jgi:hypothetical protein